MIPIVTIKPIMILSGPNLSYLFLTLEQNTPTKIALMSPQGFGHHDKRIAYHLHGLSLGNARNPCEKSDDRSVLDWDVGLLVLRDGKEHINLSQ